MLSLRIALAAAFVMYGRAVSAQIAREADAQSCTYTKCALVISRPKVGGDELLIGSLGRSEPFGMAGGALMREVTTVPLALIEAQAGRGPRLTSRILLYTAFTAMGFMAVSRGITRKGPPVLANFIGFAEGAGRGLLIVAPAAIVAIPLDQDSMRHFSRAVALYNAQLPR